MTQAETISTIRHLGMTVSKTAFGEFRINYRKDSPCYKGEDSAAHTDQHDAIGTATTMKQHETAVYQTPITQWDIAHVA